MDTSRCVSFHCLPSRRAAILTLLSTFSAAIAFTVMVPLTTTDASPALYRHVLLHMAVVSVAAVFTAAERRHLFAWSIYAPKLTFELVIGFVLLATSTLVLVVSNSPATPRKHIL